MEKRRVKIISRVLNRVKLNFPKTIQFIEDCLECSKENIPMENVTFLCKKLVQRNIFYFVVLGFKAERFLLRLTKYAKRYSMTLNSLSHIFSRII